MILLIDNYDSFTYNLYQCIGSILRGGHEPVDGERSSGAWGDDPQAPPGDRRIEVRRNDEITLEQIDALDPTHLIVSPGPCTPDQSGVSRDAIRHLAGRIPILGVCLGHQCIAQVFGGKVSAAGRLMHGKTSRIRHDGRSLFAGIRNPFVATRYHSLDVFREDMPPGFEVTAWSEDRDEVMGIRHPSLPIEGVQFHPESFLTDEGPKLITNFLAM